MWRRWLGHKGRWSIVRTQRYSSELNKNLVSSCWDCQKKIAKILRYSRIDDMQRDVWSPFDCSSELMIDAGGNVETFPVRSGSRISGSRTVAMADNLGNTTRPI